MLCDAFNAAGIITLPESLDPSAVAVLPLYQGEVTVLSVNRAHAARNYELILHAALKLMARESKRSVAEASHRLERRPRRGHARSLFRQQQ